MLVLKRKKGESILIGNDIEIVVIRMMGHEVSLGIRAPKEVNINRKEVVEDIRKNGRRSGKK